MVLATRGSPLARWQAERVAALLGSVPGAPAVVLQAVVTTGDRRRDVTLGELGGRGVFAKEVQEAVLSGEADLAVHSAKDLPSGTPEGLVIASVPERADPRDVLVGTRLGELPPGALVATGSPRRRAQLAWLRPDLRFTEVRGNIATRLGALGTVDAVMVAKAAMDRLGLAGQPGEVLSPSVMLPQVGQGALAVECRVDDEWTAAWLGRIDDLDAHRAVDAERSFLAAVGGGCRAPLGAWATVEDQAPVEGVPRAERRQLRLQVMVASGDGHVVLREEVRGDDPWALGQAARAVLWQRCGAAIIELGDVSGDLAGANRQGVDRAGPSRAEADLAGVNRPGVNRPGVGRAGVNREGVDPAEVNRTGVGRGARQPQTGTSDGPTGLEGLQ